MYVYNRKKKEIRACTRRHFDVDTTLKRRRVQLGCNKVMETTSCAHWEQSSVDHVEGITNFEGITNIASAFTFV